MLQSSHLCDFYLLTFTDYEIKTYKNALKIFFSDVDHF